MGLIFILSFQKCLVTIAAMKESYLSDVPKSGLKQHLHTYVTPSKISSLVMANASVLSNVYPVLVSQHSSVANEISVNAS